MHWRKYNLLTGCAAVVITVLVLFGGQLLWQKYAVVKPLDRVFLNVNGVAEAVWDRENNSGEPSKLRVKLQDVDNLPETYEQIYMGAKKVLGKKPFAIVILDSRTGELEQFYYEVHFMVQEAIFTGNFSSLAERSAAKAAGENIDLRVYVDAKNVYLQMKKEAAQMYVVVPRRLDNQEVAAK